MSVLLKKLADTQQKLDEVPAGFATPHNLVFDDDPIDDVVYKHKTNSATPANVLTLLLSGEPVTKEMGPAIAGIFSSNRELLNEVRTARGDNDFGELIETIWDTCRLEPTSKVSLGVRLAFHRYHQQRELAGRRVWLELTDLYRQDQSTESLDRSVKQVLDRLESEATGFWEREFDNPDTKLTEAIELLKALDSKDPAIEINDDPVIAIPGLSGVVTATAQILTEQGDSQAHESLVKWARACLATAAGAGPNHPFVADSLNRIFLLALRRAKDRRSLCLGEQALQIRETTLGFKHPLTRQSRVNLGGAHVLQGNLDAAEELLTLPQGSDPDDGESQYWLARYYQERGRHEDRHLEAEAWRNYLNLGSSAAGRRWEATQRLWVLES